MTALYELAATFRADAERLADLDLDPQTLADTLEGMGGELEVKAQNVVMFARNLEATAAAIKEAEGQMAARRKAIENRAAGLRSYVLTSMQVAGVQKIECPYFKLAIANNPPSVDIYEAALVPAKYFVQEPPPPPKLDKKAVAAAIKAGTEVPGIRMTQGQRLAVS
jgi:hypothetical protein